MSRADNDDPIERAQVERYLEIAILAARQAGEFVRNRWHDVREIEHKDDQSLVTAIDRGAEKLLRSILERHSPECAFLGEEDGVSGEDAQREHQRWWYVDPVDGTTNLAHRFPWVAVSVALVDRSGQPVVGVVYNPILEHLFAAGRGLGTTLNGNEARVSRTHELSRALLATGFGVGSHGTEVDNVANLRHVMRSSFAVRRVGAAALDLAAVAVGWFDGFWELGLSPWDTAAGWLLIVEAGGRVTALDGTTPFDSHTPQCLATNGPIHDQLAAVLTEARSGAASAPRGESDDDAPSV